MIEKPITDWAKDSKCRQTDVGSVVGNDALGLDEVVVSHSVLSDNAVSPRRQKEKENYSPHSCHSRAWEVEVGGSGIQGHLQLQNKF